MYMEGGREEGRRGETDRDMLDQGLYICIVILSQGKNKTRQVGWTDYEVHRICW